MVKYLLPFVKKGSFNGPFFHNVVVSLSVLGSTLVDLLRLGGVPSGLTVVVVTAGVTVVATALAKLPTSLTEVPMISILIPLLVNPGILIINGTCAAISKFVCFGFYMKNNHLISFAQLK